MKKTDLSRRKFLGRSGTAALALPLAAVIPAAIEATSPKPVEAASMENNRQLIPNRTLPSRNIDANNTQTVSGLHTDGQSDCSSIIQGVINSVSNNGGGTVVIPRHDTNGDPDNPGHDKPGGPLCVYMLDTTAQTDGTVYYAISMKDNVRLECKPGVKLQAMPVTQDPIVTSKARMIDCRNVSDVEIVNCWLVGERYTHVYSDSTESDANTYGIALAGVTGATIRGTVVANCTGDGINISASSSGDSSDIVLCDVISTGNRKRGLGISSGDSIAVYDSKFADTSGLAPNDGIGVEPHGTSQTQVSNLTIENCVVSGNGGCGIHLNANGAPITNVDVKNCLVSYNYWHGFNTQMSGAGTVDTGSLYGNAFYQNGQNGIDLDGTTSNYTIGDTNQGDSNSNSFADNKTLNNSITYPNSTPTDTQGYVSGRDMNISSGSLSSGTVVHWNTYYTP